ARRGGDARDPRHPVRAGLRSPAAAHLYRSGIVSPGRSSSHAMQLIFHPFGVRTNWVEMTSFPSNTVPFITPRLSYVLKRWATFPKTSVISLDSTSWKHVSSPDSTIR